MDLDELQRNWEEFGRTDPMWAVLTESDKRGGKWDEEEFFANGRALVDAIIKQLQPFGLPRGRQAALDFGCGVGRLTQAACQHFDRVIGVDIAASMIAAANNYNRFGVRCEYLHNTRPDLTAIADDSIDFVLTLLVLQHMRSELAQGYIAEFLRVLRPGGVAVFHLPYVHRDGYDAASASQASGPIMEMHATPKETIVHIIEECRGRLVACHDDTGNADWPSYVYVATRD